MLCLGWWLGEARGQDPEEQRHCWVSASSRHRCWLRHMNPPSPRTPCSLTTALQSCRRPTDTRANTGELARWREGPQSVHMHAARGPNRDRRQPSIQYPVRKPPNTGLVIFVTGAAKQHTRRLLSWPAVSPEAKGKMQGWVGWLLSSPGSPPLSPLTRPLTHSYCVLCARSAGRKREAGGTGGAMPDVVPVLMLSLAGGLSLTVFWK